MNHPHIRRYLASALVAAALLGAALIPSTAAQDTSLVASSLGIVLDANFDDGPGEWTANAPAAATRPISSSSWAWGTPTSGPGVAASGSKVWATNLAGAYNAYECGALLSPPIDLTGATSASFSFNQWRHMQQFSTGSKWTYDAGMLFVTADGGQTISRVDPNQAYDGFLQSTSGRCLNGYGTTQMAIGGPIGATPPAPVYSAISADLSAHVGGVVQVLISFGSDSSTHYAGWYVDDFAVTIDGTTTVENFEANDGGFTIASTHTAIEPFGWSHGVPTSGPASTSPGMSTNPSGNYGHLECAWVESPTFMLGNVPSVLGATARLSWDQWFRGNSAYSAGVVQVGTANGYEVVVPEDGYPNTMSSTAAYRDQLTACLGIDDAQKVYASSINTVNTPMVSKSADLSAYAGQEISIRFFFATAWSTLNPTLNPGWYIDNVAVEVGIDVRGPAVEPVIDNLSWQAAQAPGWSIAGATSWAYGIATSGPAGEQVYGTNLAGNAGKGECGYIESPGVPSAVFDLNPTLEFDHWYKINSLSTNSAWDAGIVLVSNDNGATWQYRDFAQHKQSTFVDSATKACLETFTGQPTPTRVFFGSKPAFSVVSEDLSDMTGGSVVKVRFVFATSKTLTPYEGWYLRAVKLGGQDLL